jgi:propanediol dehydratase small subunit
MDFAMTARTASRDTMTFMFDRAAECMPRAHLAALQLDRLNARSKRPHRAAKSNLRCL